MTPSHQGLRCTINPGAEGLRALKVKTAEVFQSLTPKPYIFLVASFAGPLLVLFCLRASEIFPRSCLIVRIAESVLYMEMNLHPASGKVQRDLSTHHPSFYISSFAYKIRTLCTIKLLPLKLLLHY